MGVPDLRGGLGTPTFFSTAADLDARESEQVERLEPNADGSFTAPPLQGNDKDQVLVYYKTPFGDYSDSLCVLLGTAASPATCE